jgi:hypothetical protein
VSDAGDHEFPGTLPQRSDSGLKKDRKFNPAAIRPRRAEAPGAGAEEASNARNGPYVHAGLSLPGRRPRPACRQARSGRVVSGISGQLPSNLFQSRERGKLLPAMPTGRQAPRLFREGLFRTAGQAMSGTDRSVAGWHAGANSRDRAADCARWQAAPIVPSARGCLPAVGRRWMTPGSSIYRLCQKLCLT